MRRFIPLSCVYCLYPEYLAESDGDCISMYIQPCYTLFDTGYTQLDIKYTKIYTTSVARTIASFFSGLLYSTYMGDSFT